MVLLKSLIIRELQPSCRFELLDVGAMEDAVLLVEGLVAGVAEDALLLLLLEGLAENDLGFDGDGSWLSIGLGLDDLLVLLDNGSDGHIGVSLPQDLLHDLV